MLINGDADAVAQATELLTAVEQLASEDKKGQGEVNKLRGLGEQLTLPVIVSI
jgi:hypothetical protein